ncbi:DUF7710 domain-containing protein [Saccharothrix espanaensis]|uniref:DUF7710 domain-containing protein n=1 Tax=Saccharothrix espanaensis (strain ATCC 51144 / DSM 44229 / JCM 9112 / NBRC 15066 / NRRL 15764) TaxID=1179773 RepID=K0JZC7_SACES|nr:hypothetical protein BN6_33180 [Saccharothrix espanaensis DSM 44229]
MRVLGYNDVVRDRDEGTRRHDTVARPTIWIFHDDRARFAAGVFTTRAEGLAWAARHHVTGILTEYPIGGSYDVAVTEGRFTPTRPHHGTPDHVTGFSPGLDHLHLTDGQPHHQTHTSAASRAFGTSVSLPATRRPCRLSPRAGDLRTRTALRRSMAEAAG